MLVQRSLYTMCTRVRKWPPNTKMPFVLIWTEMSEKTKTMGLDESEWLWCQVLWGCNDLVSEWSEWKLFKSNVDEMSDWVTEWFLFVLLWVGGAQRHHLFIYLWQYDGDTFCQSIQMQMCLWCLYYLNIFKMWFLWVFDWGLSPQYTKAPDKQLTNRMDEVWKKLVCKSKCLIWSALHTNAPL